MGSAMALPAQATSAPPARPAGQDAADRRRLGLRAQWDGFRAIAFVDGDDVYLQSRNGKPLRRYFPELDLPGRAATCSTARSCCSTPQGRQDFDALGQRIHPAESRINMLAEQTPTRFIAFDLLADDDESLLELPQAERRARLEALVDKPVDLTPARPRTRTRPSSGCRTPRA